MPPARYLCHMQATHRSIIKMLGQQPNTVQDILAVEEPLQIQLQANYSIKNIAVTMRTPGNDDELAAGFLFTEGVIKNNGQIAEIKLAGGNNSIVTMKEGETPLLRNTERNFYATSSCGVCGKASIDSVKTAIPFANEVHFTINASILYSLQDSLQSRQQIFETTGGLHAAALFDGNGEFILLREDVGRHNALDKLIGHFFLQGKLPLSNKVLLLSGRASFELIQKAAMAGIKIVAAIGAPSSLAVQLAEENNIALIGFLRHDKFNIYCNSQRIITE